MMKVNIKKSIIVLAVLVLAVVFGPVSVSAAEIPSVTYQTHVQNVGWKDYVAEGKLSGTEGLSYRLEGIRIALDDAGYDIYTIDADGIKRTITSAGYLGNHILSF